MRSTSRFAALLAGLPFLLSPLSLHAQLPSHAEFAQGVEHVCGIHESGSDNGTLLMMEARLSHDARKEPLDRTVAWRLACTRAQLAVNGTIGRRSWLMPLGTSWRHGASMIAARLLEDSITPPAAELLAMLNSDPVVAEPTEWTLGHLVTAINAGVDAAIVDRECVMLAWQLGKEERAHSCAVTGLAAGHDSTFHLLTVARAAALDGDSTTALMAFLSAARSVHDSTDRADLYWHLRWFLTPEEDSAWRRLPDRQAAPWLHDLLEVRDVRDGRAPGARIVEHFRRLAYVEQHFRLDVLPINRDRIMHAAAIPDYTGGGFTTLNTTPNSDTPAESFRDLIRWQVEFDDRGAVWMRFGPPEKRWFYAASGGKPILGNYIHRETWRYDLDGRELLLSFESEQNDGSQDATRLVTGVIGEHFCGIDAGKCFTGTRSFEAAQWNKGFAGPDPRNFRGISPEELTGLRRADHGQIVAATTHDDNSERVSRHLAVNAQFLRLWQPGTGRLVALVPWAIRARDLAAIRGDSSGTVPIRLEVRSYDPMLQAQHDSTLVGNLVVPDHPAGNAWVIGYVMLPTTSGVAAWSVFASHDTTAAGRVVNTRARPLASGELQLSDLVIGAARQGVQWPAATGPIAMAPLGAVRSDRSMQLYYQVVSRLPTGTVRTTVAVYRVGAKGTLPALEVSFNDRIDKGLNEVRRELGLDQLRQGAYRLEIRVEDESGRHRVSRSTALDVVR